MNIEEIATQRTLQQLNSAAALREQKSASLLEHQRDLAGWQTQKMIAETTAAGLQLPKLQREAEVYESKWSKPLTWLEKIKNAVVPFINPIGNLFNK